MSAPGGAPVLHSADVCTCCLQKCVSLVKQMMADCEELEGADQVKKYLQQSLSYAQAHLKVIQDWGRFPHRNQLLGRSNTPEEQSGLADGSIPKF